MPAGISPTQCEASSAMTHHIQLCSNGTSRTYLAYLQKARELIWLSVADIKTANQKHRNEQLNRTIQNFLYSLLATDNDVAAKKSLAVLTELWRRHVWRDARTVNVIGESASDHSDLQCSFPAAKLIQYAKYGLKSSLLLIKHLHALLSSMCTFGAPFDPLMSQPS